MSLHDALARRSPLFSAAAIREAVELLVANDVLSVNEDGMVRIADLVTLIQQK